ncbi:MAG TPA: carbon-nitrogen hydrolase family protein [Candidatus Aminicenantes bacterium]|nr:carbon-nitrogen hydrolase family protein [Candidatus Aminicenantes bacterium]
MKIALVQQRATGEPAENLERGKRAFLEAARAGAKLVAFAELAFTPFYPRSPATASSPGLAEPVPGPTTDLFRALARETGTVAVLNLFERDGERTFDSSPVIDADGRLLGVTRMVHIMEGPGFHERGYYAPGDRESFVFDTAAGRIGVAICYDRHFPEYMRGLRLAGAELVVVPQAGAVGEWTEGIFEAELQVAAFQNGYFAALANRVGREDALEFAGESYVVDPDGRVIARAPRGEDHILFADCDLRRNRASHAARHFLEDRRPEVYGRMGLADPERKAR